MFKNNKCEFLAFPSKLLLPGATEDALQRGCGRHCTVGGLHSKVDSEGVWHFYSRVCVSIKGQSLKICDIKLNNSLELFHSEPAPVQKWVL